MSIRTKLIAYIFLFISLLVTMVGLVNFYYIRPQIKDLILNGLEVGGYIQYQRVKGSVERYKIILETHSYSLMPELLDRYYADKSKAVLKELKENLNSVASPFMSDNETDIYKEIVEMEVLDKKGNVLVSVSNGNLSQKCDEVLAGSTNEKKDYFRVFKGEDSHYYIKACRPIILNDERLGVLAIIFNPKSLRAITSDYSIFGKTGETLLVFKNSNDEVEFFTPPAFWKRFRCS